LFLKTKTSIFSEGSISKLSSGVNIKKVIAYRFTPEGVNKKFKLLNKFREYTEIPVQYRSTLSDYKGSGYDRGHMAASATLDNSYDAMVESFLLSNMTLQLPGLNHQG